jgi:uncharacterized protein
MSLNKIIIIFIIILIGFAAFIFFQFSRAGIPTSKATIGEHTFNVSVARTPEELQKGLSERGSLPQDQGMLFLFDQPGDHAFWMKGMQFPIDIIFINNDTIVSIAKNAQPVEEGNENPPLYTSGAQADKVLEINAGLSDKYEFKVGDKVTFALEENTSQNNEQGR